MDRLNKFILGVLLSFYPLKMILHFFLMLNLDLMYGSLITLFTLYWGISSILFTKRSTIYILYMSYLIWILLSSLAYFTNGKPFNLFFNDFENAIIPSFFIFLGLNKRVRIDFFYKISLTGLLFCFLIGLYLYFFSPNWYINWKINLINDWLGGFSETYVSTYGQFTSFFPHPYFTGYMSFVALVISLSLFRFERFNFYLFFSVILCTFVLVASLQRVSIVVAFFFVLFFFLNSSTTNDKFVKLYFVICVAFFSLVAFFVFSLFENTGWYIPIYERLGQMSFNSAISERSMQWRLLLDIQDNFLLGSGFGSGGHAAIKNGYVGVADGEFFKFLYETGIIGVILFFVLVFSTIYKGICNLRGKLVEVWIVLFFLISIIGANPFSNMPIQITIFWFSVGSIWRECDS